MKLILLTFFIVMLGFCTLSQSSLLDSLDKQLTVAETPEGKAQAYYKLGIYYTDSMQRYRAIDHFLKSYDFYEKAADTANMAKNCSIVAANYWFLRDYDEMLKYGLKALKLLEVSGNQIEIGEATNYVAFVYLELSLYNKAKDYLDRALDISQKLNDFKLKMHVQTNIGHYCRSKKNYLTAVKWQDDALLSCRQLNDDNELIEILISAASAHSYLRDWQKSLDYLQEAFVLNEKRGNKEYKGYLLGEIGGYEFRMKKTGIGIEKIKESLSIAKEINNSPLIQRASNKLSHIYFNLDEYESAYHYLSQSVDEMEKINALRQSSAIAEMTARYETEKKQGVIDRLLQEQKFEEARQAHEEALYEAEINQKQNLIYFSFGAMFLLIVLVILIIRNNKNKSRAKTAISRKEDQIKEQRAMIRGKEGERQRIAQELHDGIGGALSMIKMKIGELSLEPSNETEIVELSEDISRACKEVRYISNNLLAVDIEVDSLTNAILSYIDKLLLSTDIKVHFDLFPTADINGLDENVKHNCYRIIQELANNAVKHAEASELTIGIILDDEGGMLRVEDNGKGFNTNETVDNGLGLKNLNHRIKALNGELTLESTLGKGSIFQIQFPIKKSKLVE